MNDRIHSTPGHTVMVVGNGGREHALAWKLAQSPAVSRVLVAPGNAGTAAEPGCENVDIAADDVHQLVALAQRERVHLTVVGPEGPLAKGLVDAFRASKLRVFGPTRAAAQLESSKSFTKDFLARHGIPTAQYAVFTEIAPALVHLRERGAPIVIKADGLAAGKGVVVAMTLAEAEAAVEDMLGGSLLGEAGARVVIEDFLDGEEASFIVVADGTDYAPLATSQDHKRVFDGDAGPNTGGMGAYSPAPVVTEAIHARICRDIIEPTLAGMVAEGTPFTGFLYAGLMIDRDGGAKVIEFNARLGDPETQPLLSRLRSDLLALLDAAVDHQLARHEPSWDPRAALGVVMAAEHYPASPAKDDAINGLGKAPAGVKVFHAGTRLQAGEVLTSGGRVLCVVGLGDDIIDAQQQAYEGVKAIRWRGEHHRNDIGWRAIARLKG
ncbi:MAG: phosphoribosylamine--glycine ligase [Pseudomonadota bacterium]|nr:phosphoribosylamine--glycine ligase [Pseudomonadota bacterium]